MDELQDRKSGKPGLPKKIPNIEDSPRVLQCLAPKCLDSDVRLCRSAHAHCPPKKQYQKEQAENRRGILLRCKESFRLSSMFCIFSGTYHPFKSSCQRIPGRISACFFPRLFLGWSGHGHFFYRVLHLNLDISGKDTAEILDCLLCSVFSPGPTIPGWAEASWADRRSWPLGRNRSAPLPLIIKIYSGK